MHIQLFQTPNHDHYIQVSEHQITLNYSINERNRVTRSSLPANVIGVSELKNYDEIIQSVKESIQITNENIKKIGDRLGWVGKGDGLQFQANFKAWIEQQDFSGELDLSNLKLTLLPMHIGLFKNITKLNLSDNQLKILAYEIQYLPKLQVLDIQSNEFFILPEWLEKKTNLEVIYDSGDDSSSPWAQ